MAHVVLENCFVRVFSAATSKVVEVRLCKVIWTIRGIYEYLRHTAAMKQDSLVALPLSMPFSVQVPLTTATDKMDQLPEVWASSSFLHGAC